MSEITIVNHQENEEPNNFSKGYLTFPFDGKQFKDFISGLLGKPQSISKRIHGNFEVHLADIQNLFELVNQRVVQQNGGSLLQFTAKIYYTDRSSVQLGSYEELLTYNEVKPIISEAVKLTWDYLIQFSDKNHPEKQIIEVIIISANERIFFETDDIPSFMIPTRGEFRINIEHTARSWGSDIENMLTNQIKSLLKEDQKFKKIARRYSASLGLSFAAIFFLISIIGAFKVTKNFIDSEILKVQSFTTENSNSANEKIDFLISYIASGISPQHYFRVGIFLLISFILSILFGVWIEETSSNNMQPSFVVLTRKAKEYRDEITEKMKQKWKWFFVSIGASLITGIVANYIFKWLVS